MFGLFVVLSFPTSINRVWNATGTRVGSVWMIHLSFCTQLVKNWEDKGETTMPEEAERIRVPFLPAAEKLHNLLIRMFIFHRSISRVSSFFTNFPSDNFLTWINDNNFQWNDSGASAGVQCSSARITNKSLRFKDSQLSDVFSLHLAGTSLRPCQKNFFLFSPESNFVALADFIFVVDAELLLFCH